MPDILSQDEINALLAGYNILVAEDSAASRRALLEHLKSVGFKQMTAAADGQDALDKLQEGDFNLLVTDWGLPKLDGLQLVQQLRSQDRFRDLPILMLSGSREKGSLAAAVKAGVDDYLLKPYNPEALTRKVQGLRKAKPRAWDIPEDAVDALPAILSQEHIDTFLALRSKAPEKQDERKPSGGKVLSQDRIDALLTATGGPAAAGAVKATDTRPIITHDFKHPTRVSKDQTRTLENLHSNLARLIASSFSTMQRTVVDCDIAFVDQTTYAEFIMSLSNPSCSYTFTIEPLGGPAADQIAKPDADTSPAPQDRPPAFTPPDASAIWPALSRADMAVSIVLGRTQTPLHATLEWTEGSLIELSKVSGEAVDVLVNGRLCARGEVVTVGENFGVRIVEIVREPQAP